MNSIFLLVPLSLLVGVLAFLLFIFAGRNKQFDDIEAPKYKIFDEDFEENDRKK